MLYTSVLLVVIVAKEREVQIQKSVIISKFGHTTLVSAFIGVLFYCLKRPRTSHQGGGMISQKGAIYRASLSLCLLGGGEEVGTVQPGPNRTQSFLLPLEGSSQNWPDDRKIQ